MDKATTQQRNNVPLAPPINLRKYLIQGVSWSFTLEVGAVLVSLASNIVLARSLGPKEFGTYAYVLSMISLLTIPTSLGLPQYLVREVSKYNHQEQWRALKGLLIKANQVVLSLGGGLTLVLIPFAALSHWKEKETFLVALPLILVNSLNSVRQGGLRGLHHIILGQLPEFTVRPLLFLSFISALWLAGIRFNAPQAMGLQVFCSFVACLVGILLLVSAFPEPAKKADKQYETRTWLKGCIPFLFLATAYFINSQTDIIMLGMIRTSAEVGIYKVAVQGAQLVVFVLAAVNTTIGPIIAELYHSGDRQKLKKLATLSARAVLAGSLPVGLVFILFGAPLISFVFGPKYIAASYPLAVLCLGQIVNAGMGSVALILNMTGNEKDTLQGVAVSAALNITLNALLIPHFGIKGAAWATTISMICWNLMLSTLVFKRLGIWAHACSRL